MKSIEILTNRLANLRDSYDHYTMVDKDKSKAFWIKNDIEEFETLLNELNELKRLKDIEKELGINILELLQDFKKQQDQFGEITKDVDVDYLAHTVLNGITYRKLSEELGCPLEAVFKAIAKGIKTTEHYDIGSGQTFKEYIKVEEPHLTFTSIEQDWLKDMDFFKDYANKWCFHFKDFIYLEDKANDEYECLVKLSDYRKTWWLKGEK